MEILTWLSFGVCVLLSVAGVALYIDGRGQRKALGAAQITIAALQRHVAAQDVQIGSLTRGLAPVTPPAGVLAPGEPSDGEPAAFSVPSTARTGTPLPRAPRDAVEAHYRALCGEARSKGLAADHCASGDCWGAPEGVLCTCRCEGCVQATACAAQAEREIMGPSVDDPDPRKRRA